MGKWFIFLLALWVAAENGVKIPIPVIVISIVMTFLGIVGIILIKLTEDK